MLLTLDPGSKVCGLALFDGTELQTAWLARTKGDWFEMARACYLSVVARTHPDKVGTLVIEKPQIYVQSRQKGDANDLIPLALVEGALAAFLTPSSIHEYKPAQWKGQVPKEVQIERIKSRLTAAENKRVEKTPKSLMHNIFDAVGLGLHHVGRRGKGRR